MPRRASLPCALTSLCLLVCGCHGHTAPHPGSLEFADVTAQAGLHFTHVNGAYGKKLLPETMGSGVCVVDYNNDERPDILFVNGKAWPGHQPADSTAALYRNNGDGTFTDVTKGSGLDIPLYGLGCAAADYDNDGREDLYITALNGSHLFHNLGNGRFEDVTAKAGVSSPGFATGAVWFDYDRDGKLDLFVGHYVKWSIATDQSCSLDGKHKSYCTPELYQGESATLYHNLGDGRFEDVTKQAGLSDPTSKSLGVTLLDFDQDGWPDLFVANDTQPDKLYRNNHDGTFKDVGFEAGVALSDAGKARAGMGTDSADYNLSGRESLLVGNFSNESMTLDRNDGGGLFTDASIASGISGPSASSLTFGAFFFDYNLDGLPDIFATNGHVADDVSVTQPMLHYAEPALLFRNIGHGRFQDVSKSSGEALQLPVVGRGAAYLDYDGDGDPDLVLTTSSGPARLLRNDGGNRNAFVRVRLVGTQSNRDGIGAVVTVVWSDGKRMDAMVKDGSSYLSQNELPLTFGLGSPDTARPVSILIAWPSGQHESVQAVAPNHEVTIQEGKGVISDHAITGR